MDMRLENAEINLLERSKCVIFVNDTRTFERGCAPSDPISFPIW